MPSQGQTKRRSTRDVDSTEKPVKRTRVSRACDQCRTAREKCDGLQPTCSTCSASKRGCTYTANPKKRGIQPGYIRSLELALAWLFQLNPDNETLLNEILAQGGAHSVFLSRDSKESNRLHKRWRKARFYTDVDTLLSGGEPSRHEQTEPLSPLSDDDDSEAEQSFVTIRPNRNISKAMQNGTTSAWGSHSPSRKEAQQAAAGTAMISMPSDGWSLFDLYFTYTQSWLPICEKHDILKLSYSYPEQGLLLAPNREDSGSHAEMWSILAVASLYSGSSVNPIGQSQDSSDRSAQLYDIARSLIPTERGNFDLGHVKALLNLTLFNVMLSLPATAWLLVGLASRVLEVLDSSKLVTSPRRRHVFAGCLLLDSLLALQLNRRCHFRKTDMDHLGIIDEDGLEEWQPWTGQSPPFDLMRNSAFEQMRTPMLALSSFNRLLGLVDILSNIGNSRSSNEYENNASIRLNDWEASLPSKLGYIHAELAVSIMSPPAVLLQLTYYCAIFISAPSVQGLQRILNALERYQKHLGFKSSPPVIQCLLKTVENCSAHFVLSEADVVPHLQKLQQDLANTWADRSSGDRMTPSDKPVSPWTYAVPSIQMPTPDSLPTLMPIMQPTGNQPAIQGNTRDPSNIFNTLRPGPQPSLDPLLVASSSSQSDPRYPELKSDLENFFDELASLDSTTRMDAKPQFMQNLGFAPDASMADLFSEYIPMQSTSFLAREEVAPGDFEQYGYYNAG